MIVPALVLLMSLSISHAIDGAESGGGGGGICTNNKCITIAEAGFRITDTAKPTYEVSPQLIHELEDIKEKLLPAKINLETNYIIGKAGDIILIDVADPARVRTFLAQYKEILNTNGSGELAAEVELFAFSTRSRNLKATTYLIREKFESLSLRSQALLFIHESHIRQGYTLTNVLKKDGAIIDFLAAVENNRQPDWMKLIKSYPNLYDAGSFHLNEYFRGFNINETTILKDGISYSRPITYRNLLDWRYYIPTIASDLKEGNFNVEATSRAKLLGDYLSILRDRINNGERNIQISNDSFKEYILEKKPEMIEALNLCKSYPQRDFMFWSDEPGKLSYLQGFDCSRRNIPDGYTMVEIKDKDGVAINIFKDSVGADLTLPKELRCKTIKKRYYNFLECR